MTKQEEICKYCGKTAYWYEIRCGSQIVSFACCAENKKAKPQIRRLNR